MGQTVFAALGYMACSSLMLIVNKLAVHFLQVRSFLVARISRRSRACVSAGTELRAPCPAVRLGGRGLDLGRDGCYHRGLPHVA